MKKLLVTLLVAATTLNLVACGSSNKGGETSEGATNETTGNDAKVELTVQVEEGWVPYYEQVKETVVGKYPNADIKFITTGSFDHLDVLDASDPTNPDVADVFALPADRLYGLANNNALASIDAETMAANVGGFKDFKGGLGGNFNVDGEYLAFPYNIETLIGYVNVANAKAAGIDFTKPIELTSVKADQILTTVHDCWFGVAFANSAKLELLGHNDADKLFSDATKEWSELTEDQQKLFTALYDYWKFHDTNKTDLWDKEAAGGYIEEQFKTGGTDVVKIDGPWATTSVKDLVGDASNLEVIPLTNVTVNGKPLTHWKGGWGLGVNARVEEDADKMAVAQAFIEEIVNPANAQDLFKYTGKILENVEPSAYEGIDELEKKVIDATYAGYEQAENRPLFTEWGSVWDSWQNALLSWSSTQPKDAKAAYNEVKASFEAMMSSF
ncbi:Maltose/maltodextrin-binding protein precursor [uncultured Clostridium sp.]|uniref:sugar ABC transporter substrate-binding protein n=1 Tax=uncultured Clostridium sp. TaxID=59620 RepID=UPI0008232934|nr:hypothetical protein [uncultured Clostridium sp.]SCI82905.1 Maltose/maltodextrin-binding protein precursor [uncultured Clostridium sp.]